MTTRKKPSPTPVAPSCANCRFGFVHPGDPETTYCREDTPEFIPPNSSQLLPVRADGWCRKWSAS